MNLTEQESIIESLLFAAGEIVTKSTLTNILSLTNKEIENNIEHINNKYLEANSSLMIREIENGYQICTRPKYHEYICKLSENKQKKNLSQAAMETLAIIAYKQPVTRQEIEKIRGINSDRSVSILAEYGLIEDIGRKEAPGRPLIYGTTQEFLRVFGYTTLNDLPEISLEDKMPNVL